MSDSELEQLQRDVTEIRGSVDRIDRTLRGNGQSGLTVRVSVLESAMRSAHKLLWLVLAACLSSIGAALVAFINLFER